MCTRRGCISDGQLAIFATRTDLSKVESEREPKWRRYIRRKSGSLKEFPIGQSSDDCNRVYSVSEIFENVL